MSSAIGKVADRLNTTTVVINAGKDKDVAVGDILVIYDEGREIIDPDTKESLGNLENFIGRGKVIHVQDRMCTLQSNEYDQDPLELIHEPTVSIISRLTGQRKLKPLRGAVGDLVKFE
ncbi:hypothetical protein HJ526_12605 [Donghicola sp. C2-DW-16]|uniref:Uncharacterized protein n=1 Tax=Donghicola mangrovi TaxID=2729614 RepID=A0ABX2PFK8_9RHOB|nr:hypothetical protein [Donghicola mangrovi]NVO28268.1 hypothetical protein [Donghicola mangrovi]